MKKFPLLFYSIILLSSCTSNRNHNGKTDLQIVSLIDRNGMSEVINNPDRIKQYRHVNFFYPQPYEKVICIHKRTSSGNIPSYLHSYHENGQPKQYLEVVNSRAQGTYKEWHANGLMKLQAQVIGGEADLNEAAERSWIFDGIATAWDEEGNLKAQIPYEKGVLCGDSIYYHPNGNIWKVVPYTDGYIHGICKILLNDGQTFQTSTYLEGKLQGPTFRYWPCEKLAVHEEYENNFLMYGRYYEKTGDTVCEINEGNGRKALFGKTILAEIHEFKGGVPEGEVKIFGPDNKPIRRYYTKNNLKHGEDTEYYEQPHLRHLPKLLVSWYEGKIQGICKTWYDNGVQESNREMSNNAKNGLSIAWYRDGTLMLIEEYEQDKLIKGEYYRRAEKRPISIVRDGFGIATLFDAEGNFTSKIYYDNGLPTGTD